MANYAWQSNINVCANLHAPSPDTTVCNCERPPPPPESPPPEPRFPRSGTSVGSTRDSMPQTIPQTHAHHHRRKQQFATVRGRRLHPNHRRRNHAVPGRALLSSTTSGGNKIICWVFLGCRPNSRLHIATTETLPCITARDHNSQSAATSVNLSASSQPTSRSLCSNKTHAATAASKADPAGDTQ